jgi:hypothetical protein
MGPSPYIILRLGATCRLAELLNHLYVLFPSSTWRSIITLVRRRSRSCWLTRCRWVHFHRCGQRRRGARGDERGAQFARDG